MLTVDYGGGGGGGGQILSAHINDQDIDSMKQEKKVVSRKTLKIF